MTGRERLVAAARGGDTDRTPVLAPPGSNADGADALVVPDSDSVMEDLERAVLVEVANPYGQALDRGDDPATAVLEELVEETRGAIRDALDAGADGVWLRLHGAQGEGYARFHDSDRALLEEIADARLNVLFAVAPFDLDHVRDLYAHVFAWSDDALDAQTVRAARPGAQASADPDSEIRLLLPAA